MNDDAPDYEPLPYRDPLLHSHAEVRQGPHAPSPAPTEASWQSMGRQFDETLDAARRLWITARHPHQDASWPHLRPNILVMEVVFERALRDQPDDAVAAVYLAEIRKFLGRKVR